MSDTAIDSYRRVLDKELERLPECAMDELENGCLEEQVKGAEILPSVDGVQWSVEFRCGRGVTRRALSRPQLKQMSPGMTVEQE